MLAIKNITKNYSGFKALDNVSFEIPSKEIFGLLGPNGAGKTTLLRIINQILQPDQGTILMDGEILQPKHIRSIGYLPEERGLYKKMSVEAQLLYLAQLRGLSHDQAKKNLDHWLDRLLITEWRNKKLENLSKGMQQKVQFIAAVIHNPGLIILDEPFTGFDPVTAEIIRQNILDLNKQGATIIISTHRMESVEQLCNSIVLINKSRKVLEGKVSEIREAFKESTYSITYKGASGILNQNKRTSVLSEQHTDNINSLVVRLAEQYTTNEFIRDSMLQDIDLVNFDEVTPSMNEIFIKTVNLIN